MLQVSHGIVVANSRLEQDIGIIGCGRNDYLDAGRMEEPGLRAGRMEWATLSSSAGWATNDHRYGNTRAPVHFARHIDNLIEAAGDEINELQLRDRPHAH